MSHFILHEFHFLLSMTVVQIISCPGVISDHGATKSIKLLVQTPGANSWCKFLVQIVLVSKKEKTRQNNAWCLVPGAWCKQIGLAWCLVPGAWCLVPGANKSG
jgi:hypothetical protein